MNATITPETILSKPFEELSKDELKEAVIAKFGGVMQFVRLSGHNYNELTAAFRPRLGTMTPATADLLKKVYKDAKRLTNSPLRGYNVTDDLRNQIDTALDRYVSVHHFCEKHPQFSTVFVNRILSRTEGRISRKMRELCKVLNVKLS